MKWGQAAAKLEAAMKGSEMSEETGLWVIIAYYNLTPSAVYGLFDSYKEAWDYAHANHEKIGCEVYDIRPVSNAFYEEM